MTLIVAASRGSREDGDELLETVLASERPVLVTDASGHVTHWNHAAERFFGRQAAQVLGRRCYDIVGGRDAFGNRFCHEGCAVMSMSRQGEVVHGFELQVGTPPRPEQTVHVTILTRRGDEPGSQQLVHVLEPIDRVARLARDLERLAVLAASAPTHGSGPVAVPSAEDPPLTGREREILRWVAAGLQNKEVAQKLGISLATVRNHVHNILDKLEVHSKLEAVSLAFRRGWVAEPQPGRPKA